ncbi:hypothetical protein [Lactococcus garvieae]|uniref:hypothetical protein n=1 Tax=Lactococcus garvieae TaxID=1363 RepID=UPI001CE27F7B|nr:hypothetical protein [Lactococcus garvieae]
MEQMKVYKFLDRPVPFTLIQDANKIKEEMISEFEREYFKLSDVYRNYLKLLPCSWLGEELAKLIKGVRNGN